MAQCSSCQFQNMPGTTHCGRCGTSLTLATAKINVYPPRATKWAKAWRKTSCWRLWNSFNRPVTDIAHRFEIRSAADLPNVAEMVRLIVPGWPQLAASKIMFGRVLFATYFLMGLLAAVCYGSTIGLIWIALAITTHSISIYDVAQSSSKIKGARVFRCLLYYGLIGFFVYLPIFHWGPQYATPFILQQNRPPFMSGDVLLVNSNAYLRESPNVGDVVLYEVTPVQHAGFAVDGRQAIINLVGDRIDRILGRSGQSIVWDGKSLRIDGQISAFLPLNPEGMPLRLSITVPEGHYFILPSGEQIGTVAGVNENQAKTLCIVPVSHIRGRVYWQNLPWTRMGPIH